MNDLHAVLLEVVMGFDHLSLDSDYSDPVSSSSDEQTDDQSHAGDGTEDTEHFPSPSDSETLSDCSEDADDLELKDTLPLPSSIPVNPSAWWCADCPTHIELSTPLLAQRHHSKTGHEVKPNIVVKSVNLSCERCASFENMECDGSVFEHCRELGFGHRVRRRTEVVNTLTKEQYWVERIFDPPMGVGREEEYYRDLKEH
ncbi:hypothetical protein EX30DRAFT_366651 [Ascodesmis nigricans]|uniref:Uncharacterized protein n=1 Tax=Ascodesmis nigricans TaxID=341454 RepID=A0A4S2MQC0_9PEZI|nr:hypothetical protein EX30DRAFT_366651 [Ascodesmis nigricans]